MFTVNISIHDMSYCEKHKRPKVTEGESCAHKLEDSEFA